MSGSLSALCAPLVPRPLRPPRCAAQRILLNRPAVAKRAFAPADPKVLNTRPVGQDSEIKTLGAPRSLVFAHPTALEAKTNAV